MIRRIKRLLLRLPLDLIRGIPHFVQRGRHGIAECDYWNLDTYLCKIAIKGIEDIMYRGCHVGCLGGKWNKSDKGLEWPLNDPEARRVHNLYGRMKRFFELHQLFQDDFEKHDVKELRRQYKASGLLLIRNFGRLWD